MRKIRTSDYSLARVIRPIESVAVHNKFIDKEKGFAMFPNEDDIRTRSYFIWVQEGRPHGRSTEHWLQAEAELKIAEAPAKPKTTRKTAKSPRAKSVKKSV